MIYLVERNSGKVRWSFSSGPALSSSYHASLEYSSDSDDECELEEKQGTTDEYDYFIECGDDGNLYEQSRHFGRRVISQVPFCFFVFVRILGVIFYWSHLP